MNSRTGLLLLVSFVALPAAANPAAPCSETWLRSVDEKVATGDGAGHGPDVGSDEWKSVVEFKLGLRGQPGVPSRSSEAWCRYIDERLNARTAAGKTGERRAASGPSFDCSKVAARSIEALICADASLSALDRTLSGTYSAALKKAANEHPPTLKAEQTGWIKGRNECWKSDDKNACVQDEYVRRIAELNARYRLVAARGPVFLACDGNAANEVVVTFFETDPPTMIAEYGDSTSLMFLAQSGSGAKYQGRNESYWEHQGEASVTWGFNAPEMRCKEKAK